MCNQQMCVAQLCKQDFIFWNSYSATKKPKICNKILPPKIEDYWGLISSLHISRALWTLLGTAPLQLYER